MIEFENVSVTFEKRKVIDNFSYSFPKTGFFAIVGPSGSGKTTLVNLMSGLVKNYEGKIKIDGKDLNEISEEEIDYLRLHKFGFIHQFHHLFPFDSVENNIKIILDASTDEKENIKHDKIDHLLKLLTLSKLKKRHVKTLSGGEKARVAVARALANDPQILLLDEPTGGLDEKNARSLTKILHSLKDEMLIVLISHDYQLVSKYASHIIEIKDGHIVSNNIKENELEGIDKPKFLKLQKKAGHRGKLRLSFMWRHFYHTFKEKKYRFLLSHTMTSIALLGVGLAISLTSLISNHMNAAYSRLFRDDQISVRSNDKIDSLQKVIAFNYQEIDDVAKDYSDVVKHVGVYYETNFETLFSDVNEFNYDVNGRNVKLNGYNIRHINEFLTYDFLVDDDIIFPFLPDSLEGDEIIISLPYVEMTNICYVLGIKRGYQDLGMYIQHHDFFITLNVANQSIFYEDQQIFKVKAIVQGEKYQIYQDDALWNEFVFEEMMLLSVTYEWDEVITLPWIIKKAYYLYLRDYRKFFERAYYDANLNNVVLDWMGKRQYYYISSQELHINRVLLYQMNSAIVKGSDVLVMQNLDGNIEGHIFTTSGGYVNYPDDMMLGFKKRTLFSSSEEELMETIDVYTNMSSVNIDSVVLPPHVEEGYYPKTSLGGVSLQPLGDNVIDGAPPSNEDEIVISSGLAKSLFDKEEILGETIYVASCEEEYFTMDGKAHRKFFNTTLKVVGIIPSSNMEIYHHPSFSLNFFRLKLGVSGFELLNEGVILDLKDSAKLEETKSNLAINFPNYEYLNPLSMLEKEIKGVTNTISIILIIFSSIAIVSSVLLLGVLTHLNIHDYRHDIAILKILGIDHREIRKMFILNVVFFATIALLFSMIQLIIFEALISYVLANYFQTPFIISVNFLAIFLMSLIALGISSLIGFKETEGIKNLDAIEAIKAR